MARGVPGIAGSTIKRNPVAFAFACGLAVAICGIISGNTVYGTGYEQVKAALEGGVPLATAFAPLKFIATTFSTISGIPGGIFAPSLAVGAGLGANIAQLFPAGPVEPIILLGMVSYFAGVVQAPITAFVIVTEMTDNHAMVIPLMAAALIAYVASRLVCPEGIYHALAKNFLRPKDGREQL
jgi:H+/Cl- antiporter ClcA